MIRSKYNTINTYNTCMVLGVRILDSGNTAHT